MKEQKGTWIFQLLKYVALFIVLLLIYLWIVVPDEETIEELAGSKRMLLADDQLSMKVPEDWKVMPKQDSVAGQLRTPELQIVHHSASGMVRLYSNKLSMLPIERLSKKKLLDAFGSDDVTEIKRNYGSGKFVYTVMGKNEMNPDRYISKAFKIKQEAKSVEIDSKNGKAVGIYFAGSPKDSDDLIYMKVLNFFVYDRMYTMNGIAQEIKDRDKIDDAMEELFKSIRWNEKEEAESDS